MNEIAKQESESKLPTSTRIRGTKKPDAKSFNTYFMPGKNNKNITALKMRSNFFGATT